MFYFLTKPDINSYPDFLFKHIFIVTYMYIRDWAKTTFPDTSIHDLPNLNLKYIYDLRMINTIIIAYGFNGFYFRYYGLKRKTAGALF
ncbi:hypothetical protein CI610_02941 [invertebrate metagenome]|uniref:Uncharacterized protein n=1 Tax=invertebrate metagenome TaxID=1711999 RepID=A0A2H9T4H8_9ZZZZ